jgi:trimeric autotransporter adhesin
MSSTPAVPVNVEMNDALQKAIADATHPDVIKARVHEAFENQLAAKAAADAEAAKAVVDAEAAKAAADAAAASAPKLLTRTENIGGVDIDFTGATEAEIDRAVSNAYKVAFAFRPSENTQQSPVVDPAIAQKAAEDAAAAKTAANAELELRFKRGELSASEYLEQSGAVSDYLAKQGIPVDALREQIEQSRGQKEVQSWSNATEVFKQTVGADWPGGERNREILGYKLAELGLTDAPDKVAALGQAWAAMKASKMIFNDDGTQNTTVNTNTTDAAAKAAADAAAAKAAADAAAAKAATDAAAKTAALTTPARSSGIFGASSGVGGDSTVGAAESKSPLQIPANATPAEIMALYNESLRREGKNPNDEFMRQFASKAR